MSRRRVIAALLGLGGVALAVLGGGCGRGENVPLVAPGPPSDWPADPGWQAVGSFLARSGATASVWDPDAAPAERRVLLVTTEGAAYRHDAAGWRQDGQAGPGVTALAATGPDTFLALGRGGVAWSCAGGSWRREDPGTQVDLSVVGNAPGGAWVGGAAGTLVRWRGDDWVPVPTPVDDAVLGVGALGDTLFVAFAGTDSLRVLAAGAWTAQAPGPWAGWAVQAVHATATGRLVVAADSLYERTAAGWRTVASVDVSWVDGTRISSCGDHVIFTLDAGDFDPFCVSVTWDAAGDPVDFRVWQTAASPGPDGHLLSVSRGRFLAWMRGEESETDLAGVLDTSAGFPVGGDGLVLLADPGLVLQTATGRRLLCTWDQLDVANYSRISVAGTSATEFWLASGEGLYLLRDGVPERVADAPPVDRRPVIALDGDGVVHLAAGHVWRWTGAWEQLDPPGVENPDYARVWPLGDGRLAAWSSTGVALVEGDRFARIGDFSNGDPVLAGADGTVFVVSYGLWDGGDRRNGLLVQDARSGEFEAIGVRGMGLLARPRVWVDGFGAPGGEPLIWTDEPALFFTLDGPPREADWRLVAGALNADVRAAARLHDGSLLVLDSSDARLHLYRP